MGSETPRRLYVGNLPPTIRKAELRTMFEQFGPVVDSYIPMKRGPGRQVLTEGFGYAFVEMQNMDDAMAAIELLHNKEKDGVKLCVRIADRRAPITT